MDNVKVAIVRLSIPEGDILTVEIAFGDAPIEITDEILACKPRIKEKTLELLKIIEEEYDGND